MHTIRVPGEGRLRKTLLLFENQECTRGVHYARLRTCANVLCMRARARACIYMAASGIPILLANLGRIPQTPTESGTCLEQINKSGQHNSADVASPFFATCTFATAL